MHLQHQVPAATKRKEVTQLVDFALVRRSELLQLEEIIGGKSMDICDIQDVSIWIEWCIPWILRTCTVQYWIYSSVTPYTMNCASSHLFHRSHHSLGPWNFRTREGWVYKQTKPRMILCIAMNVGSLYCCNRLQWRQSKQMFCSTLAVWGMAIHLWWAMYACSVLHMIWSVLSMRMLFMMGYAGQMFKHYILLYSLYSFVTHLEFDYIYNLYVYIRATCLAICVYTYYMIQFILSLHAHIQRGARSPATSCFYYYSVWQGRTWHTGEMPIFSLPSNLTQGQVGL